MTTHDDNLARVKAWRDQGHSWWTPKDEAVADHIEDVFTRHAPDDWHPSYCRRCQSGVDQFPCPDYASALALLNALDGGGS